MNTGLLQCLTLTCPGRFAPLCAFLGGILAQEALIGTTGKFSPLQQWVSACVLKLACVIVNNINSNNSDKKKNGLSRAVCVCTAVSRRV